MMGDVERVAMSDGSDIGCFVARYNIDERVSKVHLHEFIQINYIISGEARHFINGKEYDVSGGDVFVIPPMVEHRILKKDDSDAEIYELEFTPDFVFGGMSGGSVDKIEDIVLDFAYISPFLVKKEDVKPKFSLSILTRRKIEYMIELALDEYKTRKSSFEAMLSSIISQVLITIGREYESLVVNNGRSEIFKAQKTNISNAIEYINENFSEQINIDLISAKFYVSPSYFKRLFKYFTSCTFVEYITELRLSKALEMLEKTDDTITDVAMNTGFNSVNYFNRVFKEKMKMSPRQYRRQFRVE